jgi:hypothetical protein
MKPTTETNDAKVKAEAAKAAESDRQNLAQKREDDAEAADDLAKREGFPGAFGHARKPDPFKPVEDELARDNSALKRLCETAIKACEDVAKAERVTDKECRLATAAADQIRHIERTLT